MADMVINDQRSWRYYIASAGQTRFDLPFQFFEDADIEVYYKADGSTPDPTSDKLNSSQYVVTGANANFDEDRYITLQFSPPAGAAVVVNRAVPFEQLVDFTVGGLYTPETMDFINNKITVLIQQVITDLEKRGLLYPVTSLIDSGQTTIPVLGAQQLWQANALGNITAVTLEENLDVSTLRSQLLSQTPTAPGTDLIGFYDTVNSVGVDLTTFLDTLNVEYNDIKGGIPSTGVAVLFIGNASYTPTGWVMMDDGTIGNGASGATTRANDDTKDLYEMIWNSVSDTWAPVSTGRGANATDDFNAGKTIGLTKQLGRALAVSGAGAGLTARANGEYLGEENHQLSVAELASHNHSLVRQSGTAGGSANTAFQVDNLNAFTEFTNNTGSDTPHNNMQPSAFWNVIIKL